jgi:predicted nucleic acid-binding protein
VRAVVDPNVVAAGLLAPDHAPAAMLRLWLAGAFELIVCPRWLEEMEGILADRRLQGRVTDDEALEVLELLRSAARVQQDPEEPPPVRSADAGDDYVIALAANARVALVSADPHLLSLRERIPVHTPDEFLRLVETLG